MGTVARTGFIAIAVGFPVYLLFKGRLGTYLALARASGTVTTTGYRSTGQ